MTNVGQSDVTPSYDALPYAGMLPLYGDVFGHLAQLGQFVEREEAPVARVSHKHRPSRFGKMVYGLAANMRSHMHRN